VSRGIYVALSGAIAQENALDDTANNLANAQTGGYQRSRVVFREVLAQQSRGQSHFATAGESVLDTEPGATRATNRNLDVALPKGSYLAVHGPNGERYTRNGGLAITDKGALVVAGSPVAGEDEKPIVVDPRGGELKITSAGEVMQGTDVVARLRVVSFDDPSRLGREGATMLGATAASGAAKAVTPNLTVGALEESNANVTTSMTEIINASRTFEAFQTAIQTFGDIDRKLVTTVPGSG
jgi:flagellar basal-body rod protein FlgF/flagellar basal-body rod protein FlgG